VQNVSIGESIKAPGESRVVQLEGNSERVIKKMVLRYNTANSNAGKKAHVEIWGLKTNPDKKSK
jgi:hypothetical protein